MVKTAATRLLGFLAPLAVALFAGVLLTDRPLVSAGHSMLALQFAGSADAAARILAAWQAAGVEEAAWRNLEVDNVFLLFYPPAFALACRVLADRLGAAGGFARWIGVAVLAALPLDAIENGAQMWMLANGASAFAAALATACALPKFLLVAAAIGYCLYGLVRLHRHHARAGP